MIPEIKAAWIAYQPATGLPAWHVADKFCEVLLALTVPYARDEIEARKIAANLLRIS